MRQRAGLIVASAAAALVVAGCGHGGGPAASGSSPTAGAPSASVTPAPTSTPRSGAPGSTAPRPAPSGSSHTSAPAPAPPKGARTAVPASQLTVKSLPPGASGQAWTADGGRTVGTTVEVKGCERADARVDAQTAARVVMAVGITNTQQKGQMCPMIIRNVPVTIHLKAPLGDRHLILTGE